MKNLKMKKIIVALTLVMAMSGATLALASCGKDETSGTTAAETTAKVTEEETTTTEEAVTFSDADISSKAAEYEENGMTIEAIDASYIECDASVFVEGFKATDANGDEYVCVKFTDDEAGNAFINDVLCEKSSGYGVSTFNGKTWFNMTGWIEGTLENGLMEYGPEKEDDDADVDPEIVWDEEVYEFEDPEVAAFYEEYSSKGWFITPMDSTLGALEGFGAIGTNDDGSFCGISCTKFASVDDAYAYIELETEEAGPVEYTDNADGSKSFEITYNGTTVKGTVYTSGLVFVSSEY